MTEAKSTLPPMKQMALQTARNPDSWAMMAQEYHCAAKVLTKEWSRVHDTKGISLDEYNFMCMHVRRPAYFCHAFSIELMLKALLVQQNPDGEIQENGKVFSSLKKANGHNTVLMVEVLGLKPNSEYVHLLKKLEEYVKWGMKYPITFDTGQYPDPFASGHWTGNDVLYHPHIGGSWQNFCMDVENLYSKLNEEFDKRKEAKL